MSFPRLSGLLFFLLLAIGGCRKPTPVSTQTISSANADQSNTEVSKLLTSSQIQSVIGEPLRQATDSHREETGFSVSQCYFAVSTPAKSIVVTLTSRGPGLDAHEPRAFWMEKFHGEEKDEREKENEHKPAPPQRVEGIGEEAFWLGSGSTGALYVLQQDRFLRVAIGGADEDQARIEKSKKLAQFVLKRLFK